MKNPISSPPSLDCNSALTSKFLDNNRAQMWYCTLFCEDWWYYILIHWYLPLTNPLSCSQFIQKWMIPYCFLFYPLFSVTLFIEATYLWYKMDCRQSYWICHIFFARICFSLAYCFGEENFAMVYICRKQEIPALVDTTNPTTIFFLQLVNYIITSVI